MQVQIYSLLVLGWETEPGPPSLGKRGPKMGFPWSLLLFLFSLEIFIEPGTKAAERKATAWRLGGCVL